MVPAKETVGDLAVAAGVKEPPSIVARNVTSSDSTRVCRYFSSCVDEAAIAKANSWPNGRTPVRSVLAGVIAVAVAKRVTNPTLCHVSNDERRRRT
jgi:hypothetical protein